MPNVHAKSEEEIPMFDFVYVTKIDKINHCSADKSILVPLRCSIKGQRHGVHNGVIGSR